MPNIKSAIKRVRTSQEARERNRSVKSSLRTLRARLMKSIDEGSKETSEKAFREYASALDKAAKRGMIKKNTADRSKQRAAVRVGKMAATSTPQPA